MLRAHITRWQLLALINNRTGEDDDMTMIIDEDENFAAATDQEREDNWLQQGRLGTCDNFLGGMWVALTCDNCSLFGVGSFGMW